MYAKFNSEAEAAVEMAKLQSWYDSHPADGTKMIAANANHAIYPAAGSSLLRPWSLADLQAAANNAAAAALTVPVPVGGLYRTDADPSVICVRTA